MRQVFPTPWSPSTKTRQIFFFWCWSSNMFNLTQFPVSGRESQQLQSQYNVSSVVSHPFITGYKTAADKNCWHIMSSLSSLGIVRMEPGLLKSNYCVCFTPVLADHWLRDVDCVNARAGLNGWDTVVSALDSAVGCHGKMVRTPHCLTLSHSYAAICCLWANND